MFIASASSGIVIPGWAFTSSWAWMARLPLPRGRPRLPPPLEDERRRRREPLRVLVVPTPDRAAAAFSRRWYSSTIGRSSFSRASISLRFSSRKSVTSNSPVPLRGINR